MTRLCACGQPYEDSASGRHNHRVLYGHTPEWGADVRQGLEGRFVLEEVVEP